MDAHFDFQIRQQHQQSTFHGPARQFGSGGVGAFAMRLGLVAMPLMKKYVLHVAKEFGKNIVSSFVPEFADIISGKKRPRKAFSKQNNWQGHRNAASGRATGHPQLENCQRRQQIFSGNPSIAKEVIVKKSPAKRSRSDILSKINFS